MFIPGRFVPSTAQRLRQYDAEGRLREFRITGGRNSDDGGIASANSRYATESEYFDSIAPFLKRNRLLDSRRRNYIVQPGGAMIMFDRDDKMDPYLASMPMSSQMPTEQETAGHNSMDGTKFGGRAAVFNVSDSGPAGRGSAR